MDFNIEIPPLEDKNPAITRHLILKRPQASWSQSVFSVPFGNKIIPNRDYSYEGLSVLINGENFHFMDGIAVGVKSGDEYVELHANKVVASPWKAIYYYGNETRKTNLIINYYLMNVGSEPDGIVASVLLESNASSIVVEPIVDIRHMYDESAPESHFCDALSDGMLIWRDEKSISIRTLNECDVRTRERRIEWRYKLGSGFRDKTEGGAIFKPEIKYPVSMGEIEIPLDNTTSTSVIISCGNSKSQLEWLNERGRDWLKEEVAEEKRAEEMVESLGVKNDAVAFRALALSKFGMLVDNKFFYEAGDFWFRTPWFRDMFEGIINNIETLFRIGHAQRIKNIILRSFDFQDDYGRIPNRFPERANTPLDYNNADATLLAFIAAGEYLSRKGDADMRNTILARAEFTIARFATNDPETINGAPVLCDDCLLAVVPWHSWIDTRRANGVSRRIPDSWCDNDIEVQNYNKPKYRLPEINAQWIKMLSHCMKLSKDHSTGERYRALLADACSNYKKVFWNASAGNIYNIVAPDGKKDGTWGSTAVVAVALLLDEHVFTKSEIALFVSGVKSHLLVYKDGLPFGILVKESPKRTYYGDEEYHEGVVWSRDTPYLIKILRYVGEDELVDGILSSNLKHQMDEGFVFYNSELFSPDGNTLTPVKNPVQFWSQWVDPYL